MVIKKNYKFDRSNLLREEAKKFIPLGAQTFTRSYTQFPYNHTPLFIKKGKGSHIWDIDGNKYVDMLSGLLSVVLGYCDVDVDKAIKQQLKKGITFSLSSELELKLAKLLIDIIPSAEMVRYGKNGSDCTSAAIRLSRYIKKRDRVAVCGYHGWHDWYAGITTLNGGIPNVVAQLTHSFEYNNIESLHKLFTQYPNEFAAVIMEPMTLDEPKNNFLLNVKELSHKHGAFLIFDEVITGFRFADGGAQSLFNVIPDLSIFGKAIANGMPLSVLVGKTEIMQNLEKVFYSSTFAPETLSLAAAITTINKIRSENVIANLWSYGKMLRDAVNNLLEKYQLNDIIKLKGMDPWVVVTFQDHQRASKMVLRTFFQKEMINKGIFILTSHNINYAHNKKDFSLIVGAYEETLSKLKTLLAQDKVLDSINTRVLQPVFSVRTYD